MRASTTADCDDRGSAPDRAVSGSTGAARRRVDSAVCPRSAAWILITALALAAALFLVAAIADDPPPYADPAARHPGFTGECQYQEAIDLGGTIYLADPKAHQPRFLRDAVADAPYATVSTRTPDADACEGQLADGASTYHEPGDVLHAVDDWSPTFRLVSVQPSGRLVLYQAFFSTTAATAGDYLDLANRGAAVASGPLSFCDERGCVDYAGGEPRADERAERVLASLLISPIDPDAIDVSYSDAAGRFYVWVLFPDETGISLTFDCATMTSTTGIVLSDAAIPEGERRYVCPEGDPFGDPPPTIP